MPVMAGCHACTIACIAENRLPPGVVYRPVLEEEIGTYPNVTRRRHAQVFFGEQPVLCYNTRGTFSIGIMIEVTHAARVG